MKFAYARVSLENGKDAGSVILLIGEMQTGLPSPTLPPICAATIFQQKDAVKWPRNTPL